MATSSIHQHAQHEIGQPLGCVPGWHCETHHVDEPEAGYLRCGECGHGYASGWALRRIYLRECLALWRREMRKPVDADDLFAPTSADERAPRLVSCWWLLRAVFVRAGKITFCPHCLHDF